MKNKAVEYLKKYFHHSSFKEGQKEIIDSILDKKDTLGIMPTGFGKSICYQISALCFDRLTIVISPLISLMKDQIDYLKSIKYPAGMINSTVSLNEQLYVKEMVENGEIKLLYLTPERFKSESFFKWISGIKIDCFTIDEAHCISEWGHDFRPDYRLLSSVIQKLGNPPILALTATATKDVCNDIIKTLNMKNPNVFISGFNRENLIYGVNKFFTKEDKNKALIDFVSKVKPPGIIYTSSVKDAELIYNILKTNIKDKKIGIYHGGLKNEVRKNMQDDFINNQLDILIATNAFGMGVNKKDIRYVVHYTIPGSIEAYYQETGRAGRDNKTSFCLLMYLDDDIRIQEFFIESSNPKLKELIDVYNMIKKYGRNNVIYADDYDMITEGKFNPYLVLSCIKYLNHHGFIDFDYISQDKIEIDLIKKKISERDKDFLEELFASPLSRKIYDSGNVNDYLKRINIDEKDFYTNLNRLKNEKIINYNLIKKGKIIKIVKPEFSVKEQNDYEKNITKKLLIDKKQLGAMVDYANLTTCRKKYLLNYFGEKYDNDNCGGCDICRGTYKEEEIKWNEIQKNIILFVIHNEEKVGKIKALKILKGSIDVEPKYKEWQEYGLLKKYDFNDIESELNLLIARKIICYSEGKYAMLKLTHKGLKEIRKINFK